MTTLSNNDEIIVFAKSVALKTKPTLSPPQRQLLSLIIEKSQHPHRDIERIVSEISGDELKEAIEEYTAMPANTLPAQVLTKDEPAIEPIPALGCDVDRLVNSVVTVDGKHGSSLLRVFHGTNSDFVDFRVGRASRGQAADTQGAIFFTSSPVAAEYHTTVNRGIIRGENAHGANIRPAYLDIKDPFVINAAGGYKDPIKVRTWISDAKKHGNDGVIIKNVIDAEIDATADVYIVFNNSQIVSEFAHRAAAHRLEPTSNFSRQRKLP